MMAEQKLRQLKITQVRSSIGKKKKHVATLRALGLNRLGKSVVHSASDSIMGMVAKIKYLLKVEEI